MEKDKEKWVNEVSQSLEGLEKAEASPFLDNKIMSRISGLAKKQEEKQPQYGLVWGVAFALLLSLNIFAGFRYISSVHIEKVETGYNLLGDDLGLNSKTFNY